MQILENPQYDDSFEEAFQIRHQLLKLLTDGKYKEISKTVSGISETAPTMAALKVFWEMILANGQGDTELLETKLKQGLSQGVWFGKIMLRDFLQDAIDSPHLKPIVNQHEKFCIQAQAEAKAELIVRTSKEFKTGEKYPLILFLDGRNSNHRISEIYWKPALEKTKVVFASLRSSQRLGIDQYVWDNEQVSLQEVHDAYEALRQRDDVDQKRVIVSGMSQGANIAVQVIANDIIPAKGFITIAQALKPEPFFEIKPHTLVGKNLRGVIISGEKDIPRHPKHKTFHDLALSHGINCRFLSYPDIGHEYPDDFGNVIQQSVEFILK